MYTKEHIQRIDRCLVIITSTNIKLPMEETHINVLQWESFDFEERHRIIGFGRDRSGCTASFVVDDYPIRVYIQLDNPEGFSWKDSKGVSAVSNWFSTQFGYANNKRSLSDGWHMGGSSGPTVYMKHGVKDVLRDKNFFIECYYKSHAAVRVAKDLLELKTCCINVGKRSYRGTMNHEGIESVKKLTVDAKLPWTGWIKCIGTIMPKYNNLNVTTQAVEIHCSWTCLSHDETINDEVKESVLFHDIECLGVQLQFPNKYDPRCPITQITYTFRDFNTTPITYNRYCLVYGDAKPKVIEGEVPPIVYNVTDESSLCHKALEIITDTDPDVISGFNILGFDLDYFYHRCVILGVAIPNSVGRVRSLQCKYYDKSWSSSNSNKVDVKYIDMPGRIYLDVYKIAKATLTLTNYKLNTVAADKGVGAKVEVTIGEMFESFRTHQRLHNALGKCIKYFDEQNTPIPHDNIAHEVWCRLLKEYKDSVVRLQEIIYYCMVDTELSMKLYDKFKFMQTSREFANVFKVRISEVFTRGQGFRSTSLLFSMLCTEGVVLNKYDYDLSTDSYEGALNLGKKYGRRGLRKGMASVDVAGMYPSKMRQHNISVDTELTEEESLNKFKGRCTRHDWYDYKDTVNEKSYCTWLVDSSVRRGWFPRLLDDLLIKRSAAKKLMAAHVGKSEYDTYEARQLALKIVMNSIYGLIGSSFSRTPCKQLASLVTARARDELMKIDDFLTTGCPPSEWLAIRNKNADIPPFPSQFPPATIFYGDTDSVQFHYPQILWQQRPGENDIDPQLSARRAMVDFYVTLVKALNEYLFPIVVELEKIGDMILEGPKHYAIRLIDQSTRMYQGLPNPSFGQWKDGIKITGIDTVKRNQCKFHRECLGRILERMLDNKSLYETTYVDTTIRERERLRDTVDDLVTTLYRAYMQTYPSTDYEISEAYTREGVVSTMGTLARRQADLGRPIKVGERVGYVMVRFITEDVNTPVGDKARIIGDFDTHDKIDTLYYIKRMMTPYDSIMNARYEDTVDFSDFWTTNSRDFGRKLGIVSLEKNEGVNPNVVFCNELRQRLSTTKYASYHVPEDYVSLEKLRASNDYTTEFLQSTRTAVTTLINKMMNAEGWGLVLSIPNIVAKFLAAIKRDCLTDFIRTTLSAKAYKKLYE